MLPMPKAVPQPGFYYHYKHDPAKTVNNYAYEVVGVGFHTEDNARSGEQHFLIYRPLYEAAVYGAEQQLEIPCFDARPLEMWMGSVTKDERIFPRFQRITDPVIIEELKRIRGKMYGV